MNAWLPLFSTVVGGAIAFLSVHLTARFQAFTALQKERDERRLKKAEELYELILKLEHVTATWWIAITDDDLSFLQSSIDFPEFEQKRIELLSHIYLPETADLATTVLKKRLKYGRLVATWCEKVVKENKRDDSTKAQAEKALHELEQATQKLKQGIAIAVNPRKA